MKVNINNVEEEKLRKNRKSWMSLDITEKQREILLSKKISNSDILKLDRGTASMLITNIFNRELQEQPYRSIAAQGLINTL